MTLAAQSDSPGNAEENRGEIAGGGNHRRHAEKQREGLDRLHLEYERKHQDQSRPAP
jgi:hypothetical protein